jgi:hypothetical protein
MVGATDTHNLIVQGLATALRRRLKGTGCRVFTETVKLRVGDNSRFPATRVRADRTGATAGV